MERTKQVTEVSRRDFLKGTAAGAAALVSGFATHSAFAAGSDVVKVGVIGCGGRGTAAAKNCVTASSQVRITALGDLFMEKSKACRDNLAKGIGSNLDVADNRCFDGFDCADKVLASGVDAVILAAPPGFRPSHFQAAVKAGKHVFTEKPVCVDPWGYNAFCAASDEAARKKLTVVAGTQRRHSKRYQATVEKLLDGSLGKLVGGQFYWIGTPVTHNRPRKEGMSDIEWQCSNWYAWCWTCGDHIVEQHVHNLDIMCWAFGGHPEKAIGIGGRQARQEPGNIWDHFAVEFEYPGGIRLASYCSHFQKTQPRITERVVGEKGTSNCNGELFTHKGEKAWQYQGEDPDHYVEEHKDFLASLRGSGRYWNEGRQVADSCMAAILGRMAAYTGREIKWDWAVKSSKLRLGPEKHAPGPYTPEPVPVPGQTELI